MTPQAEQELHTQAAQVRARLRKLTDDLSVVDREVESLAPQRAQHELLAQACGALEKLGALGAASLFWGEGGDPARATEQLRGVRSRVTGFQARLDEVDGRRQAMIAAIGREEENLEILGEDLFQMREDEERRKLEWVVERDPGPEPRRVQRMAWSRGGEEDRRFRRTLAQTLAASLLLGLLLPMIDLPLPTRLLPEEMPQRLVQFIRQEQAKMLPPPPVVAQAKPEEMEPEPQKAKPKPETPAEPRQTSVPPPTEIAAAEPAPAAPGEPGLPAGDPAPGLEGYPMNEQPPRLKPGKAGLLAFKDQFVSLSQDKVAPRLGAQARYVDADDAGKTSTRSLLTTTAPGSSAGINLASLSRNVGGSGRGGGAGALHGDGDGGGGGGGYGGLNGVSVGRATSSIASIGGGSRPLASGGPGPARTDEEIQIVFDRYKASFYRLYNRELRNDPTLQGQMVLRLTIEPDGSVSMCVLHATDMQAPDLASQVVNRVLTINFGPKEGVAALTIVYPIDFLPAA